MLPYYEKNLREYRKKLKGSEKKIKHFAHGLCRGLQHMHDCRIAHRDIKIDNILLQNEHGDPIIIDFGLVDSQYFGDGTLGYKAPEQI